MNKKTADNPLKIKAIQVVSIVIFIVAVAGYLATAGLLYLILNFACGIEETSNCITTKHVWLTRVANLALVIAVLFAIYLSAKITAKTFDRQKSIGWQMLRLLGPMLVIFLVFQIYANVGAFD